MMDEIGTYTDSESLGLPSLSPIEQAELVKEAALIDPMTGRTPARLEDPMCDHCGENTWSRLITISTGETTPIATRRLCENCCRAILEWI